VNIDNGININYDDAMTAANEVTELSDLFVSWYPLEPVTTLSVIQNSYLSLNKTENLIGKLSDSLMVEGERLKDICNAFIDYDELCASVYKSVEEYGGDIDSIDDYKNTCVMLITGDIMF
jgi:hypothetical protein